MLCISLLHFIFRHLGHFSPRFLPTARGFDTYTGFLNGQSYYWSKRNPDHTRFVDFLQSNASCFVPYSGEDLHNYSTHLFRDKAIEIIADHDPDIPLFLVVSFQAVHDPFVDVNGVHEKGVPKEYMTESTFEWITENVKVHIVMHSYHHTKSLLHSQFIHFVVVSFCTGNKKTAICDVFECVGPSRGIHCRPTVGL